MRKNHLIIKQCLLGMVCITLIAPPSLAPMTFAKSIEDTLENNAEENDNANSFRYEDGTPITDNSLSRMNTKAPSQAWTKVNGVFVNSNLEPIKNATLKGIDVSHHQGEIDWAKVSKTDVDFAIVRSGYGQDLTSQDDAYWKANADACTKYGIPFGTYLYSYATTVEKAIGEAKHVLRLVEGYDLSYPIYYDLEDASLRNLSKQKLGEIAAAFCETIEEAGYEAAIYANTDWFTNRLTDPVFDNWDRWVAQYNSECKYTGSYNMWQCTSSGSVDGIKGNVDINFLIGDEPAAQVNKITLNNKTLNLDSNETKTITAAISPKNAFNKNITWKSSDPSIATVSNGKITAISQGSATITAVSEDGTNITGTCTVTVGEADTDDSNSDNSNSDNTNNSDTPNIGDNEDIGTIVNSIQLNVISATIEQGASKTLNASIAPSNIDTKSITWSTSDKNIATVSSNGTITGKLPGKVTITASIDNKKASCTITVKPKKVSSFTYQAASTKSIKLSYDKMSDISGYTIFRHNDVVVKNLSANTTSYTATKTYGDTGSNLKPGTTYTFKIAPYKTIDGTKVYGTKVTLKTTTKPSNTSIKSVTKSTNTKTKISWNKNSSASGYVIYYSTKKASGYKALKTITQKSTTSYTTSSLKKGKTYYIKIASYKKLGNKTIYGGYSNIKSIKR